MKQFELNTTYSTRSICDYDCIFSYTVVARTAKTITINDKFNKVKTCRINKKLSEYKDAEVVFPEGRYSMAPIITA